MKLASLKAGGRDGTLVVVSRDLRHAVAVPTIARTMQALLDNWSAKAPALEDVYARLNCGAAGGAFAFDPAAAAAPLPRAYQWLDGSAYLHHAELLRKLRNAEMPESLYHDPLMYQGGSDSLLGAHDPIEVADLAWGVDLEAEVIVITDDVPMGTSAADAAAHIRLVGFVNDVSLRELLAEEIKKTLGFVQSKPATSFSPVVATPDELGDKWDGKLHLPIVSKVNGREIGRPNAGTDMYFDYPALIAHATLTRELEAGTIIGGGTVSNRDRSTGSSCIAEIRMLETLRDGKPSTAYMRYGDEVSIDIFDASGQSVFGAIRQRVTRPRGAVQEGPRD